MLIDWGAAAVTELDENRSARVIGTPAYLAPERFRCDSPNPSVDIYALGATLFHLVLLRKPLVELSESRFWQRKRAGEIDPPTAEELLRVPRPILGIALKAMSAIPNDRYSNVSELAQALRDYLAGRNAWSAPLVIESFADDSYLERWASLFPDDFLREGGRIVSQCELGGLFLYRPRLAAGLAIEFDGEILEGCSPGDLSVIWTDEDPFDRDKPHWPKPESIWSLQVGAFSNLMVGVYRGTVECVAGRPRSIEVGRTYPSTRAGTVKSWHHFGKPSGA